MLRQYTRIDLTPNYAWELLDCEIELALTTETKVTLIQRLVELYALGLEHYESLHSYKYLYFQKKMNALMTSPTLFAVVDPQSPQKTQERPAKSESVKQKQQELQKKVLYTIGNVDGNKVQDIIRCKEKEAIDWNEKVKRELVKQNEMVKRKLVQRRQTAQLKMSQSLVDLTRHSSESSIEGPIQKQGLKVNFNHIINENQDEDESVNNADQVHEISQQAVQQRPRCRTNTVRANNFQKMQPRKSRPRSLSMTLAQPESS